MAYLYRLIAVLLCFASPLALAVPCTLYKASYLSWASGWVSTKDAACLDLADQLDIAAPARDHIGVHTEGPPSTCRIDYINKATGALTTNWTTVVYSTQAGDCPGGGPGMDAQCNAAKGELTGTVEADGTISTGAEVCFQGPPLSASDIAAGFGCKATFVKDISYQDKDGKWWSKGKATLDGAGSCEKSAVPGGTPTTKVTACEGYPGTVNGVAVCIPFDAANTPTKTEKSTTNTVTGTDGSKTTTTTVTQTTCSKGQCTDTVVVTTTATPAGGSPTTAVSGTSTTAQDQGDYCTKNPKAANCAPASTFGGSCTSGFQCEGDAALCATAKAANEQKCLLDKQSDEAAVYNSAKSSTSTTGLGSITTVISSASFDATNDLGAGAGMTDRVITVSVSGTTRAVTLPFSMVNPWLEVLGNLMLTLAYLSAMGIVFRRG